MQTAWLAARGPESAANSAMAAGTGTWRWGPTVLVGANWAPGANLMSTHGPQPQPQGQSVRSEQLSLGWSVQTSRDIMPCAGTQRYHPLGAIRTSEAHTRTSLTAVRQFAKQRIPISCGVASRRSSATATTAAQIHRVPSARGGGAGRTHAHGHAPAARAHAGVHGVRSAGCRVHDHVGDGRRARARDRARSLRACASVRGARGSRTRLRAP